MRGDRTLPDVPVSIRVGDVARESACVRKPFHTSDLLAVLRRALDSGDGAAHADA